MAIVLIGSTGNGKSTLGNFLVNPKEGNLLDKQPFRTARTNMPETQNVSSVPFTWDQNQFQVIDTPGLNESAVGDLRHMIQIVDCLKDVHSILACVLVVKFNSNIDAQYKATVQYYRKLLPSLFERNVIIVMTNFATDKRNVQLRERQGIDVDKIKINTIKEIVKSGSLIYEPQLFMIDCLPFDEEEREISLDVHSAICSKLASQIPFTSRDVMVAKTPHLKIEDEKKMKVYEGEINGFNTRLQQCNADAAKALEEVRDIEQNITFIESKELNSRKRELQVKDSAEFVDMPGWSVSIEWKFGRWLSRDFEITTTCEIENVIKWTNGHCEWKDYEQTKFRVKGKVEGEFMRGIYASVTPQTTMRKKYANDIALLHMDISAAEEKKAFYQTQLDKACKKHKEHIEEIEQLKQHIAEKRKVIKTIASDYMTLDEAHGRC